MYVHSISNSSNKHLKISLLHICFMMYCIVSLMGMFVNKDSILQETSFSSSNNCDKLESISGNC